MKKKTRFHKIKAFFGMSGRNNGPNPTQNPGGHRTPEHGGYFATMVHHAVGHTVALRDTEAPRCTTTPCGGFRATVRFGTLVQALWCAVSGQPECAPLGALHSVCILWTTMCHRTTHHHTTVGFLYSPIVSSNAPDFVRFAVFLVVHVRSNYREVP